MKFIDKLKKDLDMISWLPDYTIKESQRAKYLRIYALSNGALEITIPKNRPSVRRISEFIKDKQLWIQKNTENIKQQLHDHNHLTRVLHFPLINETWHLIYIKSNKARVTTVPDKYIILIYGYECNKELVKDKLLAWLKRKAYIIVRPELDKLASNMGLLYSKLSIRSQKTIWGSCNSKGNISINYKVIFLERELCEYILVHELSHLVYMDHSFKFWQLVQNFIPDYKFLVQRLKSDKIIFI